ncbi:hypothetical protein KIN20_023556 [Parelaphostrongylus tenuis]|uniref:Uncharacterized protein n=1 Tax=Parelaphostrongylus tenuis TaxID=148309 RepID=A0AAD5QXE8_PARTN|nr:hypothetical protein KIN20_023556 [Parelaphostrongylus tenuis]
MTTHVDEKAENIQEGLRCLERHDRSALVPDSVISNYLGRLQSNVTDGPLLYQKVFGPEEDRKSPVMYIHSTSLRKAVVLSDNAVTGTCPAYGAQKKMKCEMVATAINGTYLSISRTLMD